MTVSKQEACLERIEELRNKMVNAAKRYGMNHPSVLYYSQELDTAHNKMMMVSKPVPTVWEQSVEY